MKARVPPERDQITKQPRMIDQLATIANFQAGVVGLSGDRTHRAKKSREKRFRDHCAVRDQRVGDWRCVIALDWHCIKAIAGKDVLQEHGGDGLYQPLDLEIARCRMVVATKRGFDWTGAVQRGARIRVATKYIATAREHFAAKGMHVDLIKLYGSMELAPLVGLADVIVDLVSSGNTLKANDLVAVEDIMPIGARFIVSPAALKLKRDVVQPLLDAMAKAVAGRRTS